MVGCRKLDIGIRYLSLCLCSCNHICHVGVLVDYSLMKIVDFYLASYLRFCINVLDRGGMTGITRGLLVV